MAELDFQDIESAAENSIQRSTRSIYGQRNLNDTDSKIIARAIADAIKEYDNQRNRN